jgi:hypothetical protein
VAVQREFEAKMDEFLVKKAPVQIPENGRKTLVQYAPIVSLIGGVLALLAALGLWRVAHSVQDLANGVNELARSYGVDTGYSSVNYGVMFYVAMFILVAQGVLMLYAFSGLQARSKKRGWDILLLSVVANLVYSVVYVFTDSGSIMSLLLSLLGAVLSLYILAQVKGHYGVAKTVEAKRV